MIYFVYFSLSSDSFHFMYFEAILLGVYNFHKC